MARRSVRHIEAVAVAEEEILLVHPVGCHIEHNPSVHGAATRTHFHAVQRLGLHLPRHLQALQAVEIGGLRRPLPARIVHVIAHIAR